MQILPNTYSEFGLYSVPSRLGTELIRFVVAILAPRVRVPDLKGLGPMGDVRKFGNGGLVKGPDIRFCFSSSCMQLKIAVGFEEADCKLGAILQNSGPE